ncbi:hypothetical protein CSUI_002061 [Cystoisospora suis]|uniref:Uncharacterized protein n=1 Tax=Cystoisospora suis TaxID=483139 RepID=A0A2C6L658_9APIC|nr:hypothetical protein CSUI_002061 [Cystoisospora suis]
MEGLRTEREANRHRNLSSHIFDHPSTSIPVATKTSSLRSSYHLLPQNTSNNGSKTTPSKISHPLPVSARRPLASCLSSTVSTPGALPSCPPVKPRDLQKSRRPPLPRKVSLSEGSHHSITLGERDKNLRTSSLSSSTITGVMLSSCGGSVHTPATITTSSSAPRSLVSQGHNATGTTTTATTTTTTTTVPRSPSLSSLRSSSSLQRDTKTSRKKGQGEMTFPRETRASRLRREAIRSRSQSSERKLLTDSGTVGEESSSLPPSSSSSIQRSRPKSTSLSYPAHKLLSNSRQPSQSLVKSSCISPSITSKVDLHTASRKSRLPSLHPSSSSSFSSNTTPTTAMTSTPTQPAPSCIGSSIHPCSSKKLFEKTATLHPLPSSDPIDATVVRPSAASTRDLKGKSIFPQASSSYFSAAVSAHPRETTALPTSSVTSSSSFSRSSSSSSPPSCLPFKSAMVSPEAILHTNVRAAYPFPFPSAARKESSLSSSSSSQSKLTGLSLPSHTQPPSSSSSSISSSRSFPFLGSSDPSSSDSSFFSSLGKQQAVSQALYRKKGTGESEKKEEEEKASALLSKSQLSRLSSSTSSFSLCSSREVSSITHDVGRRRYLGKDISLFPREHKNEEILLKKKKMEKKTGLVEEATTRDSRSTPFFPAYTHRADEVLSPSVDRKIAERRNEEKDGKEEENEGDGPLASPSSPSSCRHSSSSSFISGLKDSVSTIMSYLSLGLSKGSSSSHHADTSTPRTPTADTTSLNPYRTSMSFMPTQEISRDDREGQEGKKKEPKDKEEDEKGKRERLMRKTHLSTVTGEEGTRNFAKRSVGPNARCHRERTKENFQLKQRGGKISAPRKHDMSFLREERREREDGREVDSRGEEETRRREEEEGHRSTGSTEEESARQIFSTGQLAHEIAVTGWFEGEEEKTKKKKNVFLVESGEGKEEDEDEEERPAKRMCRRDIPATCHVSLVKEKERKPGRRITPNMMEEYAETSSTFFASSSLISHRPPLLSSKGYPSSFSAEGVLERDHVVTREGGEKENLLFTTPDARKPSTTHASLGRDEEQENRDRSVFFRRKSGGVGGDSNEKKQNNKGEEGSSSMIGSTSLHPGSSMEVPSDMMNDEKNFHERWSVKRTSFSDSAAQLFLNESSSSSSSSSSCPSIATSLALSNNLARLHESRLSSHSSHPNVEAKRSFSHTRSSSYREEGETSSYMGKELMESSFTGRDLLYDHRRRKEEEEKGCEKKNEEKGLEQECLSISHLNTDEDVKKGRLGRVHAYDTQDPSLSLGLASSVSKYISFSASSSSSTLSQVSHSKDMNQGKERRAVNSHLRINSISLLTGTMENIEGQQEARERDEDEEEEDDDEPKRKRRKKLRRKSSSMNVSTQEKEEKIESHLDTCLEGLPSSYPLRHITDRLHERSSLPHTTNTRLHPGLTPSGEPLSSSPFSSSFFSSVAGRRSEVPLASQSSSFAFQSLPSTTSTSMGRSSKKEEEEEESAFPLLTGLAAMQERKRCMQTTEEKHRSSREEISSSLSSYNSARIGKNLSSCSIKQDTRRKQMIGHPPSLSAVSLLNSKTLVNPPDTILPDELLTPETAGKSKEREEETEEEGEKCGRNSLFLRDSSSSSTYQSLENRRVAPESKPMKESSQSLSLNVASLQFLGLPLDASHGERRGRGTGESGGHRGVDTLEKEHERKMRKSGCDDEGDETTWVEKISSFQEDGKKETREERREGEFSANEEVSLDKEALDKRGQREEEEERQRSITRDAREFRGEKSLEGLLSEEARRRNVGYEGTDLLQMSNSQRKNGRRSVYTPEESLIPLREAFLPHTDSRHVSSAPLKDSLSYSQISYTDQLSLGINPAGVAASAVNREESHDGSSFLSENCIASSPSPFLPSLSSISPLDRRQDVCTEKYQAPQKASLHAEGSRSSPLMTRTGLAWRGEQEEERRNFLGDPSQQAKGGGLRQERFSRHSTEVRERREEKEEDQEEEVEGVAPMQPSSSQCIDGSCPSSSSSSSSFKMVSQSKVMLPFSSSSSPHSLLISKRDQTYLTQSSPLSPFSSFGASSSSSREVGAISSCFMNDREFRQQVEEDLQREEERTIGTSLLPYSKDRVGERKEGQERKGIAESPPTEEDEGRGPFHLRSHGRKETLFSSPLRDDFTPKREERHAGLIGKKEAPETTLPSSSCRQVTSFSAWLHSPSGKMIDATLTSSIDRMKKKKNKHQTKDSNL